MRDSPLRLQDKTILLTGPFNGVTQALLRTMTEFGCDIAFVSDQTPNASRFINGVNEAREVHPEYGRAAHYNLPLGSAKEISEALGRMAESFGRTDVLIDASPLRWTSAGAEGAASNTNEALESCRRLVEHVLPFLAAKQKGRILYLFEDECLSGLGQPTMSADARAALVNWIGELAIAQRPRNITVNGLSLGVTEDYILTHFANAGSIRKSMDELQKLHPGLKLVESTEIGMGTAFLAGALSSSLTGTVLRLTHGYHLGTPALGAGRSAN